MSIIDSLLAFTFAATLLTLTPGLDTALILRTAAVEGRKEAFKAQRLPDLGRDGGLWSWRVGCRL